VKTKEPSFFERHPVVVKVLVWGACAFTMATTYLLGNWQWSRAQEKWALQAQIDRATQEPPLSQENYLRLKRPQEALHRRVVLRGHWLAKETLYLDNRPYSGRAGFWVFTPLMLSPKEAVLVQRGWVPRDLRDPLKLQSVMTPEEEVQIEARVSAGPSKMFELPHASKDAQPDVSLQAQSAIRANLDSKSLALQTGLPLVGDVIEIDPSTPDLVRDWPVVEQTASRNVGYAFQWYALCALSFSLFVWYQIIQPRRHAKRNAQVL
jgi:surfeit locus 1 family protein